MNSEPTTFRASVLQEWETEAAQKLKQLFRKEAGMTYRSFGREFDIGSQAMVSQYLNGTRPLGLLAAIKFAKGLGVTVADISPRLAAQLPTGESHPISTTEHSVQESKPSQRPATIGQIMADLAAYLERLDADDRTEAMKMMAVLADKPERHGKVAASIESMVAAAFAQGRKKAA